MAAPGYQGHHLIPQSLQNHAVFRALAASGRAWQLTILDLPDKATAADNAKEALFAEFRANSGDTNSGDTNSGDTILISRHSPLKSVPHSGP
jgi:hypothetical protein